MNLWHVVTHVTLSVHSYSELRSGSNRSQIGELVSWDVNEASRAFKEGV